MNSKSYLLPSVSIDTYGFKSKIQNQEFYQNQETKFQVDECKRQIEAISRKRWNNAVRFTNAYEDVIRKCSPKISRAYFKINEIIKDFDLNFHKVQTLKTLHLCEGPGGFIEALIDICNKNNKTLDWTGITLKNDKNDPNLPDFVKNKFDLNNITYGSDGTGDLTVLENISYLGNKFEKEGMAHLITADGGFDVSNDHCSQELQSYKLMVCQVVSAIECQHLGGTFVMKVFDCYSNEMTELLYILCIHYDNVHITKPYSSRPCNSEKYVVAQGFKGVTNKEREQLKHYSQHCLELQLEVPPNGLFIDVLQTNNEKFSNAQKEALENTLAYATRSSWVMKPKDMSSLYIKHYM